MTALEALKFLSNQLQKIYEPGESISIANWVIEHITGIQKPGGSIVHNISLADSQQKQLDEIITRLLNHEPVQYVLNESWFCGLKFYVDKNVLIPRPETEELVEWIISNCKFPLDEIKILDIGTGSGCIPITLKRRLRKAEVWSCDSSENALTVAKKNAITLGAEVNFINLDILNHNERNKLPVFDIIVSNPPYVPWLEANEMQPNVVQFEPASALFVPDNDPFIFYKAIADFGLKHCSKSGYIYCEIHEGIGNEVQQIFNSFGYASELRKDMQKKDRMIKSSLQV